MDTPHSEISVDLGLLLKGGSTGKEDGVGGSRASNGGQPPNSSSHDPWLSSIMENGGLEEKRKSQHPKIQHVSAMLRNAESNKKCFDPFVVSIGPYHHGKPELEFMEGHKMTMARQHVTDSEVAIQTLYDKVVAVTEDARKCYIEGSTSKWDDRQFAQMMFLDGCFVLRFICCSLDKETRIKSHNIAFVRRDLFLLENQLPFLVLEALMLPDKNTWLENVNRFVENTRARSPRHQEGGWLDRIMKSFFNHRDRKDRPKETKQQQQQPVHLLGILHGQLIDQSAHDPLSISEWSSYRSAIELKAAGIHFKPSKTSRCMDVSFKPAMSFGTLRLPPIMVDDSTKSMFLNLVAYESCPDAPDDFGVTSYLCFMDVLIDHAEDVKELRSNGILLNFLGSDKEVANLFNEIARDLVPNPRAYAKVIAEIERHYNNKAKVWIAEWLHTHFSTPWTFLAFLGAIFALALTCFQTYLEAYGDKKPN